MMRAANFITSAGCKRGGDTRRRSKAEPHFGEESQVCAERPGPPAKLSPFSQIRGLIVAAGGHLEEGNLKHTDLQLWFMFTPLGSLFIQIGSLQNRALAQSRANDLQADRHALGKTTGDRDATNAGQI